MNDFFILTVPDHSKEDDVVYYHFVLQDCIKGTIFNAHFRFKEIYQLHKSLSDLEDICDLPEFPRRHPFKFWKKTNDDPTRIRERRQALEQYFRELVNNPLLRGSGPVKAFIQLIKSTQSVKPRSKSAICTETYGSTERTKSLPSSISSVVR